MNFDWSTQKALNDEAEEEYMAKLLELMKSMVKDLVDAGICTALVIKRGEYDIIIDSIMAVGCGPAKHLYEVVDREAHLTFDYIAMGYMSKGPASVTVTP